MWFATPQGVNRFDGYEFKTWTKEDGLQSAIARIGVEDSEGYLWLGGEEEGDITLVQIETGDVLHFQEKFGTDLPFELSDLIPRFIVHSDGTVYFVDKRNRTLISYHHESGFHVAHLEF